MAGIHGKNAVLRVSTTETLISGVDMFGPGGATASAEGTYAEVKSATQKDWRYDRDNTLIQFNSSGDVTAALNTSINTQTRLINYAGGAIHLGQYPSVHSGVYAMAIHMELTTIANLVGDARSWTLNVSADTVDSTVIGESWKSTEDGLAGFEGSLDGLWVDDFWYKRAISTLSGLIPRTILRVAADPKDVTTYYQGTVIFPSWEMTGGYDSVVEYTVPFEGRGPLDLIQAGAPFFKIHETT